MIIFLFLDKDVELVLEGKFVDIDKRKVRNKFDDDIKNHNNINNERI